MVQPVPTFAIGFDLVFAGDCFTSSSTRLNVDFKRVKGPILKMRLPEIEKNLQREEETNEV